MPLVQALKQIIPLFLSGRLLHWSILDFLPILERAYLQRRVSKIILILLVLLDFKLDLVVKVLEMLLHALLLDGRLRELKASLQAIVRLVERHT